ncbi:hypothetical protein GCM10010207_06330 [Streptomyces atratus]|nr:hypothetical protein GCM10010207_06330 [Streptomyces atratus]
MARTAHHLPPSQTRKTCNDDRASGPWHSVVLNALRYSARSLTEAASEGRRPRPQRVRRRVSVYRFPRHNRDRGVSGIPPWRNAGPANASALRQGASGAW